MITWSDEEVRVLKEHYEKVTKKRLLEILAEKSWSAIRHKANRLGLSRKNLMIAYLCPRTVGVFTEPEKAYIAGIIDGEGTVTITCNSDYRYNRPKTYLIPSITIHNNCEKLIEWLSKKLKARKHFYPAREHQKDRWCVKIQRNLDVMAILEQILPYLIVKRKVAEHLLEFCRLKPKGEKGKYSEREYQIYREIRQLNERG